MTSFASETRAKQSYSYDRYDDALFVASGAAAKAHALRSSRRSRATPVGHGLVEVLRQHLRTGPACPRSPRQVGAPAPRAPAPRLVIPTPSRRPGAPARAPTSAWASEWYTRFAPASRGARPRSAGRAEPPHDQLRERRRRGRVRRSRRRRLGEEKQQQRVPSGGASCGARTLSSSPRLAPVAAGTRLRAARAVGPVRLDVLLGERRRVPGGGGDGGRDGGPRAERAHVGRFASAAAAAWGSSTVRSAKSRFTATARRGEERRSETLPLERRRDHDLRQTRAFPVGVLVERVHGGERDHGPRAGRAVRGARDDGGALGVARVKCRWPSRTAASSCRPRSPPRWRRR